MIASVLVTFVDLFVPAFSAVVLLRVVLSYFLRPEARLMDFLINATEPMLGPVRKLIPPTIGLDFAPLATLLLLQVLQYAVHAVF